MQVLELTRPKKPGPEHYNLLEVLNAIDEIERLRECKERVFRTYVSRQNEVGQDVGMYAFVTTSKDLHLAFGAMSRSGQFNLAVLLEMEFLNRKCTELFLRIPRRKTIFVTRSGDNFNFAVPN